MVLLLTACSPSVTPALSASELVGTWIHANDDGSISRLIFDADNTLVAESVPADVLRSFPDGLGDDAGHWVISDEPFAEDLPTIKVSFDSASGDFQWDENFYIRGDLGARTLFLILGDPDNRDWFDFSPSP
jgi:hypothetical protein